MCIVGLTIHISFIARLLLIKSSPSENRREWAIRILILSTGGAAAGRTHEPGSYTLPGSEKGGVLLQLQLFSGDVVFSTAAGARGLNIALLLKNICKILLHRTDGG